MHRPGFEIRIDPPAVPIWARATRKRVLYWNEELLRAHRRLSRWWRENNMVAREGELYLGEDYQANRRTHYCGM